MRYVKITRGTLGWGNRKTGYEVYGPQGRWYKRTGSKKSEDIGDLLGDHLDRQGFFEGDQLIIVSLDRFASDEEIETLIERIKSLG